ncbi:MAG: hypothetical protein IT328_17625 [Caldilineaceae bacterium]|nr:hypothetical protein [Caldilineaceae bacterium]
MAQENRVEVVNKFGWRKDFVVDKPIIQIGRDARNDLVLDDGFENGIAPRHAQLLPSSINRQGLRLINLSDAEILVYAQGGKAGLDEALSHPPTATVAPRSSAEVAGGDLLKLGDFSLILQGGATYSEVVKLSLDMPSRQLTLDRPLTGVLGIHHVGNKAAVQFKIELEGLDPDSYEIGPGPVLFPNAEKQVSFRLIHPRRAYPPAGAHQITFHVSAPDAYPNERATVSQEIEIAPIYQHKMRVVVMDSPEYRLT